MIDDTFKEASLAAFSGLIAGDGTHENDAKAAIVLGGRFDDAWGKVPIRDDWKPTARVQDAQVTRSNGKGAEK